MSFFDSLGVALFMLSLVFVVLVILYFAVTIVSTALRIKSGKKAAKGDAEVLTGNTESNTDLNVVYASTGEVKLRDVDEKTAAMIMAIVSHESNIPLSELCFKSIKAID